MLQVDTRPSLVRSPDLSVPLPACTPACCTWTNDPVKAASSPVSAAESMPFFPCSWLQGLPKLPPPSLRNGTLQLTSDLCLKKKKGATLFGNCGRRSCLTTQLTSDLCLKKGATLFGNCGRRSCLTTMRKTRWRCSGHAALREATRRVPPMRTQSSGHSGGVAMSLCQVLHDPACTVWVLTRSQEVYVAWMPPCDLFHLGLAALYRITK